MRRSWCDTPVARVAACALLALLPACGASRPPEPEEERPASVGPIIEEAEQQRAAGDLDAAIASYEEALERTPWNDRIRYALAMTHAERAQQSRDSGHLPPAERELRKALELLPEDPSVRHNLAVVLLERADLDLDPEQAAARRAEAMELAPDVAALQTDVDAGLERRLDLAFELLERGQLEAGVARLESLQRSYPQSREVSGLLGQALVRQAGMQAQNGNYEVAGATLDRAVAVYVAMPDCAAPDWSGCKRDDASLAHHNRVVTWMHAGERARARDALSEARAVGLRFPDLESALGSGS
jgi:tetratricopeptide (TPR) repeat protein